MKVFSDLHTHSKYSKFHHGKNTIEELVVKAIDEGLETIAITDHAPGHPFGVWPFKLKKRKAEIEELRKKYPQIKILCGLETDLTTQSGKIDVSKKQRDDLDICLMGFHRTGYGNFWRMITFGLWRALFMKNNIEKNTQAYINAINNNKIDIVTHLQQYIKVDVGKVAEAAAKRGTLIEINNRHLLWTSEDVAKLLATDCKFVIDSDAHKVKDVGNFKIALDFIEKYKIPHERIVNLRD